eukprot:TRINITY_DN7269_c0_g3_i9.p3 TRINITY_DN7269_c0_g3~~TRINITY_DN7269_c0_g3_i9.p3  ORF type:complete len:105 (-),score=40.43 TRINITY_DN7269_c0_g3_i9:181-495(-)
MCIRERIFFFFKQKTAYEIMPSLVGSEMCIRDRTIESEECAREEQNHTENEVENVPAVPEIQLLVKFPFYDDIDEETDGDDPVYGNHKGGVYIFSPVDGDVDGG